MEKVKMMDRCFSIDLNYRKDIALKMDVVDDLRL
jgi:hypothetical protein